MFATNKTKYEHVAIQTNKQIAIKEYYLYDDGYIISSKPPSYTNCYSKVNNVPNSRTFCISIKDVQLFNKEDREDLLNKVNEDIRQANQYHLNKKTKAYQEIPEITSYNQLSDGMKVHLQTAQDGKTQDTQFIDFATYVKNLDAQQKHTKYRIAQKTIPEQKQCIFVTYMGSDFETAFHIMQLKLLFLHARKQFTAMTKQLVQGRDVYVRKFHFVNNFFGVSRVAGNKLKIGSNKFQFFASDQSRIIGEFTINIDILVPDESIDPVSYYQVYFMKKFDRIVSQKKRSAQTQTYDLMTPEGNIIELEE